MNEQPTANFRSGLLFITAICSNAENDEEISLRQGEKVYIRNDLYDGWLEVQNSRGHIGIVPKDYISLPLSTKLPNFTSEPLGLSVGLETSPISVKKSTSNIEYRLNNTKSVPSIQNDNNHNHIYCDPVLNESMYPQDRISFSKNPLFQSKKVPKGKLESDFNSSTISDISVNSTVKQKSMDYISSADTSIDNSAQYPSSPLPPLSTTNSPQIKLSSKKLQTAASLSNESNQFTMNKSASTAASIIALMNGNESDFSSIPTLNDTTSQPPVSSKPLGVSTDIRQPTEQSALVAMLIANKQSKQQSIKNESASSQPLNDKVNAIPNASLSTETKTSSVQTKENALSSLSAPASAHVTPVITKKKSVSQVAAILAAKLSKSSNKDASDAEKLEDEGIASNDLGSNHDNSSFPTLYKPISGAASVVGSSASIATALSNREAVSILSLSPPNQQEPNEKKHPSTAGILAGRQSLQIPVTSSPRLSSTEPIPTTFRLPSKEEKKDFNEEIVEVPDEPKDDWIVKAAANLRKSLFNVVDFKDLNYVMKQNDEWFTNMMENQRKSFHSLVDSVNTTDEKVTEVVMAAELLAKKINSYKSFK